MVDGFLLLRLQELIQFMEIRLTPEVRGFLKSCVVWCVWHGGSRGTKKDGGRERWGERGEEREVGRAHTT